MANILVVDDEVDLLTITAKILEISGHNVTTATGGQEAFEKWKGNQFDLVLSDMRMPKGTGLELIIKLRAEGSDVPVVFMTGYSQDLADAGKYKPFSILKKPCGMETVVSTIESALTGQQPPSP